MTRATAPLSEFTLRLSYNMHGNRRHIHRMKKGQIVTMSAHLRPSAIVNKWEVLVVDDVPVEHTNLHSYVRPTSQAHIQYIPLRLSRRTDAHDPRYTDPKSLIGQCHRECR